MADCHSHEIPGGGQKCRVGIINISINFLAEKSPLGVDIAFIFWCNECMDIISYLKTVSDKHDFALRCGTSVGYLRNIGYGFRKCAPVLAARIERESSRRITRQELRPSDWQMIWPELVETTDGECPS